LTNLPLVGGALSELASVEVRQIQVQVTSATISAEEAQQLNEIIQNAGGGSGQVYPPVPPQGMASTVHLSMGLNIAGYVGPLSQGAGGQSATGLPPTSSSMQGTPAGLQAAAVPSTPGAQTDGTAWFDLQKAIGPVMFRRIGVRYDESVLWFLLDASFK